VARPHTVHIPSFGYGRDGSIDQTQGQLAKPGIQLESPNDVCGERRFIFVPGSWVEYLRNEFSHGAQRTAHMKGEVGSRLPNTLVGQIVQCRCVVVITRW
jgi:hypothetical protein